MTRTADVLVIGGGIAGCSAALQLARRGQRVIVTEKNSVGRHASGVNAGGVRRLLRDPAEIPLSVAAMEMWRGIAALVGDDCGFRVSGQVAVAETEAELARLAERAALVGRLGYCHEELLDRDALFTVLPALSRHCVGGLIARGDGFASPYHTTLAFSRAAVAAGAVVLEGCRAGRLARRGGTWRAKTSAGPIEAPILLNCAGAWAGAVAAQAGEHPPLQPVAPMMMVSTRMAPFVTPVVIGLGRKLSFKQAGNGSVLIGGGHRGVPDTAGRYVQRRFPQARDQRPHRLRPVPDHARRPHRARLVRDREPPARRPAGHRALGDRARPVPRLRLRRSWLPARPDRRHHPRRARNRGCDQFADRAVLDHALRPRDPTRRDGMMLEVERPSDLAAHVGATLGPGEWLIVEQRMIDRFAEATGDRQWIHVDVERARREMPGGRTIAHGYLLLALLPRLSHALWHVRRRSRGINYGSNRVRFTAPVAAGARVRLSQVVGAVEPIADGVRVTLASTLALEGSERPALVAETVSLLYE